MKKKKQEEFSMDEQKIEEPILNEETDQEIDPESEIIEEEKKTEQEDNITEELKKEIEKLNNEKNELIEKVKYAQAELVSYRMRKDEETQSLLKYCNQDLITEILPIIDNFENALKLASKSDNPEISKYLTGFQMMYQNLLSILNKYGVEVINRPGEIFDSKLEQALVADNNPELGDEVIIDVLQKGYKLKDRVIRPASVKINQL